MNIVPGVVVPDATTSRARTATFDVKIEVEYLRDALLDEGELCGETLLLDGDRILLTQAYTVAGLKNTRFGEYVDDEAWDTLDSDDQNWIDDNHLHPKWKITAIDGEDVLVTAIYGVHR